MVLDIFLDPSVFRPFVWTSKVCNPCISIIIICIYIYIYASCKYQGRIQPGLFEASKIQDCRVSAQQRSFGCQGAQSVLLTPEAGSHLRQEGDRGHPGSRLRAGLCQPSDRAASSEKTRIGSTFSTDVLCFPAFNTRSTPMLLPSGNL